MKKEWKKKDLGLFSVCIITVSTSLGAGVMSIVRMGFVATGSTLPLTMVMVGLITMLNALLLVDSGVRINTSTSYIGYVLVYFGELVGVIGLTLLFNTLLLNAVPRIFSEYFIRLVALFIMPGIDISDPQVIDHSIPWIAWLHPLSESGMFNPSFLTLCIIMFSTYLSYFGLNITLSKYISYMSYGFIFALISFMLYFGVNTDRDYEFKENMLLNGYSGLMISSVYMYYNMLGYDSIIYYTSRVVEPKKNILWGLIISISFLACVYALFIFAAYIAAPFDKLTGMAPIVSVFYYNDFMYGNVFICILAVLCSFNSIYVCQNAACRQFLELAKLGMFPSIFKDSTNEHGTNLFCLGLSFSVMFINVVMNEAYLVGGLCYWYLLTFSFNHIGCMLQGLPQHQHSHFKTYGVIFWVCGVWFYHYLGVISSVLPAAVTLALLVYMQRYYVTPTQYDGFQFSNRTVVPCITLFTNGFMFGTIDFKTMGVMGIFLTIVVVYYMSYPIHYFLKIERTDESNVTTTELVNVKN